MLHPVGGVTLAQEALSHRLVLRERAMHELDGDLLAIVIGRREHGRHAAEADDSVEGPLAAELLADPIVGIFQSNGAHRTHPSGVSPTQRHVLYHASLRLQTTVCSIPVM